MGKVYIIYDFHFLMNHKEETLNSYNQNTLIFADKFAKLLEAQKQREIPIFESMLNGNKILDLGCGCGDHSLYFKQRGYDVISIDISEEMIKLCLNKNLNAHVMDIENISFKKNSFNGIWAVTSLLHIKKSNIRQVLKKLHEILTEDGILYVCLKEGVNEELIEDKNLGTKRFFAFWKKQEFLNETSELFELVEYFETKLDETKFIEFYLRKK